MPSIRELREKLQDPRKPYDTFYGRYFMRRLSIYITAAVSKTSLTPSGVTLISLIAGFAGAYFLSRGEWIAGLLWVNGWYLLDHVDGELARLRGASSLTGLYFDTITNAFVPPLSLAALGNGLFLSTGDPEWLYTGFGAAYAALILLILSYCGSTVILQWMRDKDRQVSFASAGNEAKRRSTGSFPKRAFAALHFAVTFPVFLPVVTGLTIVLRFVWSGAVLPTLQASLFFYAVSATCVWILILVNSVSTRKIDADYASMKK